MSSLKFVVLGAGSRGQMFSKWLLKEHGAGSVIAVAEPNPLRREVVSNEHGISSDRCFNSWRDLLEQPKMADVVINTTLDSEHIESATIAMRSGYHMLLEKPMAVNLQDCETIDKVRRETGRMVSVCHSLRYHAVFSEVRRIIQSGVLGDIISYDQLEAVEHIHMAHSFVRGNWRRQSESTFMLLSKSCHDVDILMDMVGKRVESVSSYGELSYFRPKNAPEGAPEFCVEGCPHSNTCPYESTKLYLGETGWAKFAGFNLQPRDVTLNMLSTSNYGKCVFKSDNDVVDHQVVAFKFEGGATATFTMTAFTPTGGRFIRVHGSKGYLEAKIDERTIEYWEFWKNKQRTQINVPPVDGMHGGADSDLIKTFISAVELNRPDLIKTDTETSLRTHTIVFLAEQSRLEGRAISVPSS